MGFARGGPLNEHDHISETEARRLWERAAQLQAEAADDRKRPSAPDTVGGTAGEGYPLAQVRQAAVEAGIAGEFIDLALAEGSEGADPKPLVVRHRFHRSANEVYVATRRVFPRLGLSLLDFRGNDPLEGGTFVFEFAPGSTDPSLADLYSSTLAREIQLRIRPTEEGKCEIVLSALPGAPAGLKLIAWMLFAGATVVGWWVLGAIGAGVAAAAGLGGVAKFVTIGAGMLAGAGAGATLGHKGLRTLHRRGLAKGATALRRLLSKLGVELEMGNAFAPPDDLGSLHGSKPER